MSTTDKTILIHTSVKLVTQVAHALARGLYILIHTSVKLVTIKNFICFAE